MSLSVVDLFAGAGGLSEGFHRHKFNIVASVEKDKYAAETLLTRHIYWSLQHEGKSKTYFDYINQIIDKNEFHENIKFNPVINMEISEANLPSIVKRIRQNMRILGVKKIDVFIGGPPCQAYSIIGRAVDKYKMEFDPRNKLYQYYVKLLQIFKPKMFVFENVPGILSAGKGQLWEDVKKFFEIAGYTIDYKILDAFNFGVLQSRKRVILVGWKKKLKLKYPEFDIQLSKYLVQDLLSDLPPIEPGYSIRLGDYATKPTKYLEVSKIRTEQDVLWDHIARPTNTNDRQIYRQAIRLWKEEKLRLKYNLIPEKLRTREKTESFMDCYKVVASDISYSHTMIAHIAKDGHYYIHPDEGQLRSITVREAARIQSFPDNYNFEGPRTSQFTQIGNAVPPLMAEKIAEKIKGMIS